LIFITPRVIKL